MPWSRILRLALLVAVVGGIGWGIKARYFPSGDAAPQYLTATVTRKDLEQVVLATGTLEAVEQVSVGAQVSGQIKSLKVDFGDVVGKGDVIAEIDSKTQENNLKNAEAQLANVTAQRAAKVATLKQAEAAFARQKRMLALNAVAREAYEAAEAILGVTRAEIDALDAQIAQAGIEVSTAELNLGYTRITAPIDGTVVAVVVQEGQTVNANQTTPTIVKLAQLGTMTVKAEISEADIVNVAPGQAVYFTILGRPDTRFEAVLRAIEPAPTAINSESGTTSSSAASGSSSSTAIYYNGAFDVPNPDGLLRIDMTAQVSIVLGAAKGALTVPASALGPRTADGRYTVTVVEADGRVAPREIRTGMEDTVDVEVLDGLREGERIVLGDTAAGTSTRMRMPRMGL
ncbi:efflux RND transporter periplasmic adaptor subunit [Zavarzinia compransoris]|uniref:Efflux transporter periplasmic adaptor subunit n=1 Tax=Zavarzinia compransoris TaxID=1264899 RepID=A0A317DV18_9PROT|nr:efflux RND transporter periplasmic adaptor subunit [Zavarzinia compransoris]PWR18234.1 efflux transporter periplasmic adaptor subunit [Zavarzinia compransoris]TDP40872.1 macrolide-specific efflux system membrane fusion protein [Zavarzinia compransoris]